MNRPLVVAVVAAGEMGSGVGARLAERGCRVLTSLAGRSAATGARAEAAGMADVADAELAAADIFLSIAPPAEALAVAERFAPALQATPVKPLYADCNAVGPDLVREIGAVIGATGAPFVDAGIIGVAPQPSGYSPVLYCSGPDARRLEALNAFGLTVRALDGPVGQASALKLCYAGFNKGMYAVGLVTLLAAIEAGVEQVFLQELASSQSQALAYLAKRAPTIFPKTYRWVAEMQEIAQFAGGAGEAMFTGAAELYAQLAADHSGERTAEQTLLALLAGVDRSPSR
jgi:3-hydroxyisobutyrate dehydrogenase-like beta-hydroxyacid dehydrogenase